MERRQFLGTLAAAGVASSLPHARAQASVPPAINNDYATLPKASSPGTLKGEMLYRPLGRTGETVSAIGMGGAHLGSASLPEDEAIRLIHEGLDRGINFLDNCWDYNGGNSELRMGKALAQGGYRKKAFLMTKIDGRTKPLAAQQIETSLKRLQTDHIDLLQHHEIIRYEDPDRVFDEGGSMEAVLDAQKAGKVRFIGFTGHKDPHVHLYMLDVAARHGFHFDAAQMPLNVMDAHYRSFSHLVVPRLVEQQVGVLGMKSMGDGIILKAKVVSPVDCLRYALNLPTSVVITGINSQQVLDQAFQVAKGFRLMDEAELAALLTKTAQSAKRGTYELFKTTALFDGTAHHPEWLGGETPEVKQLVS